MVIPSDWIGGHARLPVQTSGVLGEGLVGGFNPTHLKKYVRQKWVRIFPQFSGWRFQEYLKPTLLEVVSIYWQLVFKKGQCNTRISFKNKETKTHRFFGRLATTTTTTTTSTTTTFTFTFNPLAGAPPLGSQDIGNPEFFRKMLRRS